VWLGLLSHGSGGLARTKSQSSNLTESVGAGETRHDTRPPVTVYNPDGRARGRAQPGGRGGRTRPIRSRTTPVTTRTQDPLIRCIRSRVSTAFFHSSLAAAQGACVCMCCRNENDGSRTL
jgi:hypothetical protein